MSTIWAKGCMLMSVCVCYLTLHDYPSLLEGESHCISLLLFIMIYENNFVCTVFSIINVYRVLSVNKSI